MQATKSGTCCRLALLKRNVSLLCIATLLYVFAVWTSPYVVETVVKLEEIKEFAMNPSCDRILRNASLPKTSKNPWFVVDGCKLHNYSSSDASTCMRRISSTSGANFIALLGDSRMRSLFEGLVRILGNPKWKVPVLQRHRDYHYYSPKLETLVRFRWHGHMNNEILLDYIWWEERPKILRPRVIIQGHAMWDLTFGGHFNVSSRNFKGNLTTVLPHMTKLAKTTDILWMIQDPPDVRKLNKKNVELRGPLKIDAFNKMAVEMISPTPVKMWHTARMTALRFPTESDASGIHYLPHVIDYKVQLFLNWYCNRHMDFEDGTCCSNPVESPVRFFNNKHTNSPTRGCTTAVSILLWVVLGLLLMLLCLAFKSRFTEIKQPCAEGTLSDSENQPDPKGSTENS